MTLGDMELAARRNSENYEPRWRGCASRAFLEGACWAYEYLTKQGNTPAWCVQNVTNNDN